MKYRSRYSNRRRTPEYIAIGIIAFVLLIVAVGGCTSYNKTETIQNVMVTGKESVTTSNSEGGSDHEYRVYTNKGTFVVKDSLWHTRFNSADVYGRLKEGQTYDCVVYGWRIPFFSSFKNILSCKVA